MAHDDVSGDGQSFIAVIVKYVVKKFKPDPFILVSPCTIVAGLGIAFNGLFH